MASPKSPKDLKNPKAPKRARGERAGLTREQVLDAALALVDREGVRALTMRRLGTELDVEAMTLYHYVSSKDALLDGLVERVFAQALPFAYAGYEHGHRRGPGHDPGRAPGHAPGHDPGADWREMLRTYADTLRATLLRHPGVLPLATTRTAVTPATLDAVERGLAALTAAGFPLGTAIDALNTLSVFVVGHAAAEAGHAAGNGGAPASRPGSPAWPAELDTTRYPLVAEAARTGAGTDDEARFRFGVGALLAGFGRQVDAAS
ncbi:TetR/AcrR family transcriptional regulator C-terminal domain-containing protein [Streptomyces sp. NPDC049577]|uniref:TetR/AcrR family transcriptional regulator C-terminal domain-containing protein n=1 Tax=Streptomyces sp. NPDC049577 TaxID=3155153 RepID=UPI003444B483